MLTGFSFIKGDLDVTRPMDPLHFKYRDVWLRAKTKLLCSLRISKFMEEIVAKRDSIKPEVQDYLYLKAGLYNKPTIAKKKKLPFGIIHPNSKFKQSWNIIIGILILYTTTVSPFEIAFINSTSVDFWFVCDTIIDFCYILDVIINCNTAYYDSNASQRTSRKEIMMNYLKGWLVVDIISCIPISFALNIYNATSGGNYNKLVRIFRLRSIPRLFRFSKAVKLIKTYQTNFLLEKVQIFFNLSHSVMRLLATLTGILVSLHIVACFWYLTSTFTYYDYETWVNRYDYVNNDIFTLYITSIYWAITTLTTVGYGDIVPFSDAEYLFTIIWLGATMYFTSFTVSSLSSVISMIDIKKKNLELMLNMVDEFAKEAMISKATKLKMENRIRYTSERLPICIDEEERLMREIPKDLKFQIACNMHDGFLNRILFFKNKDKEFITAIALFLQPAYYSKKDVVISKGEAATEIFIVLHGAVNYVNGDEGTVFKVVSEGMDFGDIEVLLKMKRLHRAVAACETTLLIMGEKYVKKIRDDFPGIWKEMKEKARKKLFSLNYLLAEVSVLKKLKMRNMIDQIKPNVYKEMISIELEIIKISYKKKDKTFKEDSELSPEMIKQINENFEAALALKTELMNTYKMLKRILNESSKKPLAS